MEAMGLAGASRPALPEHASAAFSTRTYFDLI
jgi:hypothetical protein